MYRRETISSLKSRNYDFTFGALYALNGLLPDKYRITISTIEYNKLTKQDIFVKCNNCKEETDFKAVQVFLLLMPLLESAISGNQQEKVWICPGCKHENKLLQTEMSQRVLKEPYFLKVVPKPPLRKDGLNDRSSYHRKVTQWALTFLDELETQMAQFRDDNWQKSSDALYDIDTDTYMDESKDAV